MSGPHDEARDEAMVAWVFGELSGAERDAFARRLATDPVLAAEVSALEESLAVFGTAASVTPPPALRDRVLAMASEPAVAPTETGARPHGRDTLLSRAAPWLGLAAAAAILVAVKFQGDAREVAADRDSVLEALATRTAELAERDSLLARLTDPEAEVVSLAATGAATPRVRVQLDRKRRLAVLSVTSLDAPPTGQTYQLWYIVDGAPIPSTAFAPAADGTVLLTSIPLPPGDGVQAVAVTLEPAGGSETPTMPILFVGAVGAE